MATIINLDHDFELPTGVEKFDSFRRWSHSDAFPESGRIDYLLGRIEVDMSPDDLYTHGSLKIAIVGVLYQINEQEDLGELFSDRTRIASVEAELSAEPDILFFSHKSIESGAVRRIRKASAEPGRFVELEGAIDLIVEIVSDSSKKKDMERLPRAYFAAGVREYWLVDVRRGRMVFQIHRRGDADFVQSAVDTNGFSRSEVFSCGFRLERTPTKDEEISKFKLIVEE